MESGGAIKGIGELSAKDGDATFCGRRGEVGTVVEQRRAAGAHGAARLGAAPAGKANPARGSQPVWVWW